jgi:sarcosine oxidase, subunit gamma
MLEPASPLDALDAAPLRTPRLQVTAEPIAARLSLRLRDEAAITRLGLALGLALPREACRAADGANASALWLGPDEWLVVSRTETAEALAARAAEAIGDTPHSLVDVSHRSVTLRVEGADAALALNAFCPLDLGLAAFPPGAVTRTVLGKTEIVLWREAPDRFLVDVWRSFAPYALGLLREEARSLAA